MCGICGIFEFDQQREVSFKALRRMTDTIVHRGPDDDGFYVAPGIGFGFRRLSIIDVAGGHQPLANEDGTIWAMLNGEIYNYPELRRQLADRGHKFSTRSDTETIVHLYEEVGVECFARLRGMFAIAIWDSRNRTLVLGRDRVGKKPLYYAEDKNRILFGSELKCLLAGNSMPRDIDNHALADYFSFGYVPAPKTIYRAARKLLPGHYLVASARRVRTQSYWDISFGRVEQRTEEEWCDLLRHHLCQATQIRLMSEVPLGAFLSGGLDSSSVVAMMTKAMNRPATTCSIRFEEHEYDEATYARQVAEQFHTDHHEHTLRPDALGILEKLVWHYDEPFADSSAIPTYYVSQVAREHVTVALGGDGGDESFAGYRRYYFDAMENQLRRFVPGPIRRGAFGPLSRAYPPLAWAPRFLRAKATFESLARSPLEGYFNSISIFRPGEKPNLFTPDFRASLAGYDSIDVLRQYYDRAGTDDLLSRIQYVDIKTYLPDDILTKVDRASMAVSLEVRAPLLDHPLMETVASMPSQMKLVGRNGKYIFKKAMTPILNSEIIDRKKQGFAVPLDRWFRKELRDVAHTALFASDDGVLNPRFLKKIWDQHQKNQYDRSAHLWSVLMYRKWREAFTA